MSRGFAADSAKSACRSKIRPSPIIGVTVGNADNMRRIHQELKAAGIILPYSTYSGAGKEGTLRIAVFATHTDEMLDRLLDELQRIV